jgi:hypothetical protein
MTAYFIPAISFLAGALIAMIASHRANSREARLQQDILKRGIAAQGRVTRIWQPPLAGRFARIYFEFEPEGAEQVLQCCHIDRRSASEWMASLPAAGASVTVRYLPENPARAVIAKLVSRFKR